MNINRCIVFWQKNCAFCNFNVYDNLWNVYQNSIFLSFICFLSLRDLHFCFFVPLANGLVVINVISQRFLGPFRTAAVNSDSGGLYDLEIFRSAVILDPQTFPRTNGILAVLLAKLIGHAELRGAVAQFVRL